MESRNKKAYKAIVGCSIAIFFAGSMTFGFPGVMSTYWQEEFNVGAAETGAVVTFMLLALSFAMFFSGKVHMVLGVRKCIIIGLIISVLAMLVLIAARNIYMVYLWGFINNIGCSFIYSPGLATTQQWMPHRRGFFSGIPNLMFGIAAAVTSPIMNAVLNNFGKMALYIGIIVVFIVFLTIASILATDPTHAHFTIREERAHTALIMFSIRQEEKKRAKKLGVDPDSITMIDRKHDMNVIDALKSKDFWIIWLVWAFCGAAGISMVSLSKSYAIVIGVASVTILTVFNLFNGAIRILVGYLSDIIGGEITAIVAFSLSAIGYLILPHTNNLAIICVCAAFIGLSFGTLFTVSGPMLSKKFGLTYFALIFGLVFTAYGLIGGIVGPALAGIILEKTGSYTIVFTYLAVFSLIGAVLMVWYKQRQLKN